MAVLPVAGVSGRRLVGDGQCAKAGICQRVAAVCPRMLWAAAGTAGNATGGRSPWSYRPCPSFQVARKTDLSRRLKTWLSLKGAAEHRKRPARL